MSNAVTFTWAGALRGVHATIPLAISDFSVGIVFGALARQAGMSPLEAVLMSGLVSAGTSQFVALGLWVAPLSVWQIALTTLVVNLRHVLFGAALRPWFSRLAPFKAYGSMFFMTDETWAMLLQRFNSGQHDAAFMVGSGMLLLLTWISGTFIGATAGAILPNPERLGLDFVFVPVMLVLLVGLWQGKSDLLPWAFAATVALAAYVWMPGERWYILLGGLAGSAVGVIRESIPGRDLPLRRKSPGWKGSDAG